jgi:hypothetical protein
MIGNALGPAAAASVAALDRFRKSRRLCDFLFAIDNPPLNWTCYEK